MGRHFIIRATQKGIPLLSGVLFMNEQVDYVQQLIGNATGEANFGANSDEDDEYEQEHNASSKSKTNQQQMRYKLKGK